MLKRVSLGSLWARLQPDADATRRPLDTICDWASVLSLGEQQRLSFARLLLASPRLAILDEATSACDLATEALLYKETQKAGITCISVGHRPSLQGFHSRTLVLQRSDRGGTTVKEVALEEAV